MPELRGSLVGIGLPALVRFLTGLQTSGRLHIAQDRWAGDLWLDRGRVAAAAFGAERGRAALDAVALLLPHGQFALTDEPPPHGPDEIETAPEELHAHLERSAAAAADLAPLLAAEWTVVPVDRWDAAPDEVVLARGTLQTLLAVSTGKRTVEEIAGHRGMVETVHALHRLRELGLIQAEGLPSEARPSGGATGAPPEPAAAPAGPAAAPPGPAAEWVAVPPEEAGALEGSIGLDHHAFQTLLAVKSGRRTVEEIAGDRGLAETVEALGRLRELGLVRPVAPDTASTASPAEVADVAGLRRLFRPRAP